MYRGLFAQNKRLDGLKSRLAGISLNGDGLADLIYLGMARQIPIDRQTAAPLRCWLRRGYMVPAALPALCPAEDEAPAPAQTGAARAELAPPASRSGADGWALVAGPADVQALIFWLESRR